MFLSAHRDGVHDVVAAARSAGVERVVLMSSGSVVHPSLAGNAITEEHREVEHAFLAAPAITVLPIRPLVLATNALEVQLPLPGGMARSSLVLVGVYKTYVQPRLLNAALGPGATREIRTRVCAGLRGDVVEIGYGSGLNQPYLPPAVTGLTVLEPSTVALKLAEARQAASPVPVVVAGADARRMALPDDRFDAALCTWALCGIPDPLAALSEVRRVLRPGAALHFVEHGLAPDENVVRWQRRGNALNKRLAGCVLDRDVSALLAQAGLTVIALELYYDDHAPKPAGFFYEGRATA